MATGSHIFSDILLHMNWHCKYDRPLITPKIEPFLHGFLANYCRKDQEVFFQEVNGTEDHVHLVVEVLPTVTVSDWIGKIKGASSHEVNQHFGSATIQWQRGYGVVSFARKNLPGIRRYVQRQKEHHRLGTTNETLERHAIDPDEAKPTTPAGEEAG
jgi:putative transposase